LAEIKSLLTTGGFADVAIKERFDCFRGTSKEKTALKYGALGMNIYARKP
jgi:hypothetical protein